MVLEVFNTVCSSEDGPLGFMMKGWSKRTMRLKAAVIFADLMQRDWFG
jgi:hypothetical protein